MYLASHSQLKAAGYFFPRIVARLRNSVTGTKFRSQPLRYFAFLSVFESSWLESHEEKGEERSPGTQSKKAPDPRLGELPPHVNPAGDPEHKTDADEVDHDRPGEDERAAILKSSPRMHAGQELIPAEAAVLYP